VVTTYFFYFARFHAKTGDIFLKKANKNIIFLAGTVN